MSTKRQRTEVVHTDAPLPFMELTPWELDEPVKGEIQYMAVDNKRGVLYLWRENVHVADGVMVRQVVMKSTASEIVATIVAHVSPLRQFPPGVVPIIGSYANGEGETRWESCVSPDRKSIMNMEVNPVSGDLVCCLNLSSHLIQVHPNGTLNYAYPEESKIVTDGGVFTFEASSGQCFLVTEILNHSILVEAEIKWTSYMLSRLPGPPLPNDTSGIVMDERYIYVVSGDTRIHRIRRPPVGQSEEIFNTVYRLYPLLAWCGPNHLLFALTHSHRLYRSFSILLLDLTTLEHRCVVTDLPRSDPRGGLLRHELDFCFVQDLARGPCILIRLGHDFRTLPLTV